jgi:hypothetical protein
MLSNEQGCHHARVFVRQKVAVKHLDERQRSRE